MIVERVLLDDGLVTVAGLRCVDVPAPGDGDPGRRRVVFVLAQRQETGKPGRSADRGTAA